MRTELGLAPVGFGNAIYTGQGAVPLKEVGNAPAANATVKREGEDALAKYRDDQLRLPAGQTGGGRWTSEGTAGTDAAAPEQVAAAGSDRKRPGLTEGEIALARKIFDDRIDYGSVMVLHERRFAGQPSNTTISPGSSIFSSKRPIYFPENSPVYHDDFSQGTSIEDQAHLIHELTHVLQDQEGISVGAIAHLAGGDYKYDLLDADGNPRPFSSFGLEQQAEIVQDYFLLKHDRGTNFKDQQAFPQSTYERVLDVGPDGTIRAPIKRPSASPSDRGR